MNPAYAGISRCCLSCFVLVVLGCEPSGDTTPGETTVSLTPPPPPPPTGRKAVNSDQSPPVQGQNLGPENSPPLISAPPLSAPPPGNSKVIRLSTGIALAQSLPTGTGMLISVKYQWTSPPKSGREYALMIRLGDGTQLAKPIPLSYPNGTIQAVLPGIKPDRRPFHAAVFARYSGDQSSAEQLSDFLELTK